MSTYKSRKSQFVAKTRTFMIVSLLYVIPCYKIQNCECLSTVFLSLKEWCKKVQNYIKSGHIMTTDKLSVTDGGDKQK